MARLTGPLHSETASGTVGGALTFSMRASGPQARRQRKQKYTPTAAQIAVREIYGAAVEGWRSLDSPTKETYNDRAESLFMSGYNLFVQEFLYSYYGGALYGFNEYGASGA